MTHWTIARLPLDQPRITDLRVEWLAREDGVRGVPRSGLLRKVVELLPGK